MRRRPILTLTFALVAALSSPLATPQSLTDDRLQQHSVLEGHTRAVNHAAFSPDGSLLATSSLDGRVIVWLMADRQKLYTIEHDHIATEIAFSPDGEYLVTGSYDMNARIVRARDGELLSTIAHAAPVSGVSFSPDGTLLATRTGNVPNVPRDPVIRLWRVPDGALYYEYEGHTLGVTSMSFSPDGEYLASSGADGTARLWSVAGGFEVRRRYFPDRVGKVVFSPDGTEILSIWGWNFNVATLLSAPELGVVHLLNGHTDAVMDAVFSPDGFAAATGGRDNTVRIWDAVSGQTTAVLTGHTRATAHLAVSPDGAALASGSWDGTTRLWTLPSGQPLKLLQGEGAVIHCVAFSPDGRSLVTGDNSGIVILWEDERGFRDAH